MEEQKLYFAAVVGLLVVLGTATATAEEGKATVSAEASTSGKAEAGSSGDADAQTPDGEGGADGDGDAADMLLPVEEEPVPEPESDDTDAADLGLNADLGIATLYNFRGINVFREDSQQDQNALIAPSLTWHIFDTGVYIGYWGAYQLTGNNQSDLVRAGAGNEQDFFVGYDLGFLDGLLTLNALFTTYLYPFADEDVAGTGAPAYIEPLVGVTLSTVLDVSFSVSYFHGIQEEIDLFRYVYFHLFAGKGVTFNEKFGMNFGLGFGGKVWIENVDFNRFDLLFSWGLPINITERLYMEPAVYLGWTDLDLIASGLPDDPATPDEDESFRDATGGDEFMVYGSLNIGANF